MKRSILCLFVLCVLLVSCGRHTLYYPDVDFTPTPTAETELLPGIEPVYTDGLVPEGYEPFKDDLVLPFSLGETIYHYLVNPYSARTVRFCHDPLCTHEPDPPGCPEIFLYGPILCWDGKFFFSGADRAEVDWYEPDGNGGWIVTRKTVPYGGRGIIRYDPLTLERKAVLKAEDRAIYKYDIPDMVLYGDDLYYYDRVQAEDNKVRQHLYRLNLKTGKAADLGEYLGYRFLIVQAGYIWNYYGFLGLNDSPLWEDAADYFVRCDLDNRNPEKIPVRKELGGDIDGYILPRTDPDSHLRYLLYVGDRDEPHVYETRREILSWEDGIAVELDTDEDEKGILFRHDYRTGEDRQISEDWAGEYKDFLPTVTCVYANRYAIYAMHETRYDYRASYGRVRFYVRVDIFTGECVPILAEYSPAEGGEGASGG